MANEEGLNTALIVTNSKSAMAVLNATALKDNIKLIKDIHTSTSLLHYIAEINTDTDTEQYVKVIKQKRYRSAYAKFRCGVAPIKLETCRQCRYGLNRMHVDQRSCESCNVVEDECHVIMHCSLYVDIRIQLLTEINNISDHFPTLSTDVQFVQIMSNPQYYRSASRAMHNILSRWRCTML